MVAAAPDLAGEHQASTHQTPANCHSINMHRTLSSVKVCISGLHLLYVGWRQTHSMTFGARTATCSCTFGATSASRTWACGGKCVRGLRDGLDNFLQAVPVIFGVESVRKSLRDATEPYYTSTSRGRAVHEGRAGGRVGQSECQGRCCAWCSSSLFASCNGT